MHVAGGLDRPAGHREHVVLDEPVHPGNADCREQRADGRRDEADRAATPARTPTGRTRVDRERLQGHHGHQEHERQTGEQDVERDLVRRLLASRPSTSAIIRSRNVSPGSEVTRTRIQSEMTRVPPVTADRSPPDSRMTGADSPVMADSSTDATPSTISPSAGYEFPRADHHHVVLPRLRRRHPVPGARRCRPVRDGFGAGSSWACPACALPRPSAIASAKLAKSTVIQKPQAICSSKPSPRARLHGIADEQRPLAGPPDFDDEHHRVLRHRPRVELPDAATAATRAAPGYPRCRASWFSPWACGSAAPEPPALASTRGARRSGRD